MARNADQIVTQQLGQLHLQLVISQARNEALEEQVAELMAKISVLEAQLPDELKKAESGTDGMPG